MKYSCLASIMLLFPFAPAAQAAATLYVSVSGDNTTGADEVTAFVTIQAAVDAAATGDTVSVGEGIYAPFRAGNKAITIRSAGGPARTIIDGGNTNRCATLGVPGTSKRNDTPGTSTLLEGFTLRNGRADAGTNEVDAASGGGAFGGTLADCVITNCFATYTGGGAHRSETRGCVFVSDTASHGGGTYTCNNTRAIFLRNHANLNGGAAFNGNTRDSLAVGNTSAIAGGAGWAVTFVNCTLVDNTSAQATAQVTIYGALYNCVIAGDLPTSELQTARLYCFTGSVATAKFRWPEGGDYRLRLDSPCLDSGSASYLNTTVDLSGNARIIGTAVDKGAYERFPEVDVMFVLDATAKQYLSSNAKTADGVIADAVRRTNLAFANSGLPGRIRTVQIFDASDIYTYNADSADLQTAMNAMTDTTGTNIQFQVSVKTAKATSGADLVCLLVDTGSAVGVVGKGKQLTSASGNSSACYSVCAIQSVESEQTLAHELGHNFGCGHAKGQADEPGPSAFASYAAGWAFTGDDGARYGTIMTAQNYTKGQTLTECGIFSSPLVSFHGTVIGNAADGDNARVLRTTMPIAERYVWNSIESVAVAFNANGGTVSESCRVYGVGAALGTLPMPVREGGYAFIGWSGFNTIVSADTVAYPPLTFASTTNTLTACWRKLPGDLYSVNSGAGSLNHYYGTNRVVVIPETIRAMDGSNVTIRDIADGAFQGQTGVEEIVLPDTVTNIGSYAFAEMPELRRITLGTGIQCVGFFAFNGNPILETLTLPASTEQIERGAFGNCTGLTNLDLSATSLESLPDQLCYRSSALRRVALPAGLRVIGTNAFYQCKALADCPLPSGLRKIELHAFSLCTSLPSVTFGGALQVIGSSAFSQCSALGSVSFAAPGPEELPSFAFYQCSSLTNCTLAEGLQRIGTQAFGTTAIGQFALPSTLTAFSDYFNGCTRLSGFTVAAGNKNFSAQGGILYDFSRSTLLRMPCTFAGVFTVPATVTRIGTTAFNNCTALTAVRLPEGLQTIGDGVFVQCSSIRYVSLPPSVTDIADGAFKCCFALRGLYCEGDAPAFGSDLFNNVNADFRVYRHAGASGWEETCCGSQVAVFEELFSFGTSAGTSILFKATEGCRLPVSGPGLATIGLESADSLQNPVWLFRGATDLPASGLGTFLDPDAVNIPARFYRVRMPRP